MKLFLPSVALIAIGLVSAFGADNPPSKECVKAKVEQAIACGSATVAVGSAVVAPNPATIAGAALSGANCVVKTQSAAEACKTTSPAKKK